MKKLSIIAALILSVSSLTAYAGTNISCPNLSGGQTYKSGQTISGWTFWVGNNGSLTLNKNQNVTWGAASKNYTYTLNDPQNTNGATCLYTNGDGTVRFALYKVPGENNQVSCANPPVNGSSNCSSNNFKVTQINNE